MICLVIVLIPPPEPKDVGKIIKSGDVWRKCPLKRTESSSFTLTKRNILTNRGSIGIFSRLEECSTTIRTMITLIDNRLRWNYCSTRCALFMWDENLIKPRILLPTGLQTRITIHNEPEIRLPHDLIHVMFLMNHGGHLIRDFCSCNRLGIIANRPYGDS